MKKMMIRSVLALAVLMFSACIAPYARAQQGCVTGGTGCAAAPEIDPSLAGTGLAVLGGAVLLIRVRRRRKPQPRNGQQETDS
jgi:MYXO-CTERM domain-containing protein